MEIWRIEMLGGLRVSSGDRVIDKFPTQMTAALLAYLATFPRTHHSREVLCEIFWPDADPDSQRHSLRLALSRLRALFGLDHPLDTDRQNVQLNRARFVTDVAEFEGAIARGDGRLARRLYTGHFLPGFYDDWVIAEQTRLESLFDEIVEGESRLPETLPRPSSRFFGRTDEQAAILKLLSQERVITLTGPGGIGKTRLALAVAKEHGSALWIPLADFALATHIPDAIKDALRLPTPAPGFPVEDMVARELAEVTPLLLVLDNAEHMVGEELNRVFDRLIEIDELNLLVTSRCTLGASGEVEIPVGPLAEQAGFDLFDDRARRTRPDIGASPEAMQNVARSLGGMPLALELAAARIGVQDLTEIGALEWTSDSAFGETFGIPARHRSLDAVLKSSLDQLPDEVRTAFSRLGVFRGGFDPAAAKAVARVGPAVLESLRRLALIVAFEDRDGSLRFRMLEPLRDVAIKESGDARTAHAAYFADWIEANRADELPPPPRVFGQRIALQIRERDNVRAALETSSLSQDPADREVGLRIVAAFWSHWYLRNEGAEMERWARLLLSGPGEKADPMIRASARLSLGLAIRERGAREEWAKEVAEAVEILQRGPRNRNLAFALHNRGLALDDLGKYDEAEQSYLASEAIWREIGDDRNFSVTRHNRGMIALSRRDLDLAEMLVGEAREFFELHNSTYVSLGHATIGSIRRAKGNLAGAAAALSEAARLHRQMGYVRGWAQNERDLGICLFELGRVDEARALIEGTIAAFRRVGDRHGEATALAALARVTGETWHADEARGVMSRHEIPAVGEFLERL